jgi:oxalate decarboxylase
MAKAFLNAADAMTQDFTAGDVGYIPQTLRHYVENTGDTDPIFWRCSRRGDIRICRSMT